MIKDKIFPLIILYYFTNKSPIIEDFFKNVGNKPEKGFKNSFFNTSLLSVHIFIIYFL